MKINFEYSGVKLEVTYNDNGFLEFVKDIDTDKYLMIESKVKGTGYEIKEEGFMIGGKSNVCDARYVRIMDVDIFIPRLMFIKNLTV